MTAPFVKLTSTYFKVINTLILNDRLGKWSDASGQVSNYPFMAKGSFYTYMG